MQEVEFRVLCADEEACKRVRFYQETGVDSFKKVADKRANILGTPFYENLTPSPKFDRKVRECNHDVPMAYHYELMSNPEYAIEANCTNCSTIVTLIPYKFKDVFKNNGVEPNTLELRELESRMGLAIVDFPNYDRYGKKKASVA